MTQAPEDRADERTPRRSLGPATAKPAWFRWVAWTRRVPWFTLLLAGALVAKYEVCEQASPDCRATVKNGVSTVIVEVCRAEYARTGEPRVGALLANALRRSGDLRGAEEVAEKLLTTSARADALYVLGKLAAMAKRFDEAQQRFERAIELHSQAAQWTGLATDLLALGEVKFAHQDYLAALEVLDRGIHAARKAGDAYVEGYCHLGAARVLTHVGHLPGARAELQRAEGVFQDDADRAFSLLEQGYLEQRGGDHHQAVVVLERALAVVNRANLPLVKRGAEIKLAESLADTGRLAEATQHLEILRSLDVDDRLLPDRLALEGQIAHYDGHLEQAAALLDQAIAKTAPDSREDLAAFTSARAKVALEAGDLTAAVTWAGRSVSSIEEIRAKQAPLQFRSWLTARYREVYELWFLSLARAGRADEALVVLDRWQGQEVLDALTPQASAGDNLQQATTETQALSTFQAALRDRALATPHALAELKQRLAAVDVLAVVLARGEVWRLSAHAGAVELTKLGLVSELSAHYVDKFRADPTNAELGAVLGYLLIPPELARVTSRPLHVLLDSAWTTLPFEALRVGRTPLVALRPVLRVTRPSEVACSAPRDYAHHAVVLADAYGDLAAANLEAAKVAARFGVASHTGLAATAAALYAATEDDLLHVAVHADVDVLGGALLLRDGKVAALDVAARGHGPAQVVLAACASAVAQQGNYSLAMAYLAAGSQQVIATLRPVTDAGAGRVIAEFYQRGGEHDPVRALASAQAALAATDNRDWPYFSVFGREICSNSP